MSTETNLDDFDRAEALRQIDEVSANAPVARTLTELQLVVERITFSKLHEREDQGSASTLAEVDLFFRDEVSEGMLLFVRWMARQGFLRALADESGRVFLNECVSRYENVPELEVVTAIDLTDDHKTRIVERLRRVHPEPARILFSTSDSLIAGFVINSGSTVVVDKSLRTHVSKTVSKIDNLQELAEKNSDKSGG